MNQSQSNKLSMLDAVAAVFTEFASKFTGYVALIAVKTELVELIVSIKQKDVDVKQAFAGKTSAKDLAKESLISALLPFTKKLFVFAKKTNNQEMKTLCHLNKSDFIRMRENDLETKANMIYKYLNDNKTSLADYMITDQNITDLQAKINTFKFTEDAKDTGFSSKVGGGKSLNELFDRSDELLGEDGDSLMEHYAETEKEFYDAYHSARVIKDLSYHQEKPPTTNNTDTKTNS